MRARAGLLAGLWAALWTCSLAAQSRPCGGTPKLREQLDPAGDDRPALVQVTWPDTGRVYFAADAALAWPCTFGPAAGNARFEVAPGVEWHRNSGLASPQDVLAARMSGTWFLRPQATTGLKPIITASAGYKRDGIARTNALSASAGLSARWLQPPHLKPGCQASELRYAYRMGSYHCVFRSLFRYTPRVGGEYESQADSLRRPSARLVLSLQTELYPATVPLHNRIQLVFDGAYRRSSIVEGARRDHWLLAASANVVLVGQLDHGGRGVAVGFDYIDGADPSKGFVRQHFARLGLKAQL